MSAIRVPVHPGKMTLELGDQIVLEHLPLVSMTSDVDHEQAPEIAARPDSRPDGICEQRELKSTLARADREAPGAVSENRFPVGGAMGVNGSPVSHIHKTALKKMATVLQGEGIRSAAAF